MGKMIGAAEFKAHCLRILDEVQRSGEPVTITKRGKPVGELHPPKSKAVHSIIGCMEGTVRIVGGIEGPAYDGRWNAEVGLLGDED